MCYHLWWIKMYIVCKCFDSDTRGDTDCELWLIAHCRKLAVKSLCFHVLFSYVLDLFKFYKHVLTFFLKGNVFNIYGSNEYLPVYEHNRKVLTSYLRTESDGAEVMPDESSVKKNNNLQSKSEFNKRCECDRIVDLWRIIDRANYYTLNLQHSVIPTHYNRWLEAGYRIIRGGIYNGLL